MSNISAVLFDFGMVLSGPPCEKAWQSLREHSGIDEEVLSREYWAYRDDYDRGTLSAQEYWGRVGEGGGVSFSLETMQCLMDADLSMWTKMNQPLLQWVQQLHAAGIRTGILSNMGDAIAQGICSKFDWIGNFHHTVWSHTLKIRKPEPAIYQASIDGLGVPAGEILFLDDKIENIEAAEISGMQGIVYSSHADFEEEMKRRGYEYLLHPETMTAMRAN